MPILSESRPLVLSPQEAFLAVKCLTDAARMAWATPQERWEREDTPDKSLRERFDLALWTLRDGGECSVSITYRDCWTLALWIDVAIQIGATPTGLLLRNKLTQLRLEFEVGDVGAAAEEPPLTGKEAAERLKAAQPWLKHPRDAKGRFQKRTRGAL